MKKIANRLVQCILTLFIVSVLCFALTKAAPGDPVLTYVEPNMSEEYIQNLRESLGLTKPLYEQYFLWLGRIFHGNFGNSLMNNRPVLTQMLERLPATVILMGTSMLLGFLIAIVLGLYSGKNKNGILDKITSLFCYVGISIPTFWFGIMLIYLFSVHLHILPSIGMHSDGASHGDALCGADFCQCIPVYPVSEKQYHYGDVLRLCYGAESLWNERVRDSVPPCTEKCHASHDHSSWNEFAVTGFRSHYYRAGFCMAGNRTAGGYCRYAV